ncbi:MAG: hypothetical protein ACPGUD_12650 [Parashewanella sp.]
MHDCYAIPGLWIASEPQSPTCSEAQHDPSLNSQHLDFQEQVAQQVWQQAFWCDTPVLHIGKNSYRLENVIPDKYTAANKVAYVRAIPSTQVQGSFKDFVTGGVEKKIEQALVLEGVVPVSINREALLKENKQYTDKSKEYKNTENEELELGFKTQSGCTNGERVGVEAEENDYLIVDHHQVSRELTQEENDNWFHIKIEPSELQTHSALPTQENHEALKFVGNAMTTSLAAHLKTEIGQANLIQIAKLERVEFARFPDELSRTNPFSPSYYCPVTGVKLTPLNTVKLATQANGNWLISRVGVRSLLFGNRTNITSCPLTRQDVTAGEVTQAKADDRSVFKQSVMTRAIKFITVKTSSQAWKLALKYV